MSIFDIDYKEVVYNLYKEYSDEIINLLVYEGILYEFDCGFGGKSNDQGMRIYRISFKR